MNTKEEAHESTYALPMESDAEMARLINRDQVVSGTTGLLPQRVALRDVDRILDVAEVRRRAAGVIRADDQDAGRSGCAGRHRCRERHGGEPEREDKTKPQSAHVWPHPSAAKRP